MEGGVGSSVGAGVCAEEGWSWSGAGTGGGARVWDGVGRDGVGGAGVGVSIR